MPRHVFELLYARQGVPVMLRFRFAMYSYRPSWTVIRQPS